MGIKIQGKRLTSPDLGTSRAVPRQGARATHEFRFGVLPSKWDFYPDTGEFLPSVQHVQLTPGVNGVIALRESAEGRLRVDASALEGLWRRKGGVLIDPSDVRLGEWKDYIQTIENDAGHLHHCSIFESLEVVGRQVFHESDQVEFRRFKRHLIASGLVAPIHPQIKRVKMEAQKTAIDSLRKRFGANPAHEGLRQELAYEQAKLRAMAEERPIAEMLGEVQPLRGVEPIEESPAPAPETPRGRRKVIESPPDPGATS